MTHPKVTVIVPAYNEEKHIEECFVSVKQQTYPKIELIVIDDGSTDKTRFIAKKYADVLLTQKHQGPGVARNRAAKIAKGKILAFVDADMYLDKKYIENIIKPIILKKAQSSYTQQEYIANPNNIWVKCYIADNNVIGNEKNIRTNKQENFFRAIKKNYFLKIGGYNPRYGYSDDYLNREKKIIKSVIAKNAICFHINPETLLDIFISSRWIGRSPAFKTSVRNILRYSPINSIIISIKKIFIGAPFSFIFYKLYFDFGILSGILFKNSKNYYAK